MVPLPFSLDLVFVNPYYLPASQAKARYRCELVYGPNEHLHLWKTDSWSQYGSCLPVYHGAGRSLLKEGGEWYHSLSSDWQCRIHTTIMKGQDILIVSCTLNQWKEINHPFYQKKVHMLGGGGGGPRESPKTLMTPKFKKGKVDNTIPWINLHQLDSAMISLKRICWTVIIQSLSKAKQPGLEHETSGPLQEDIK